MHAERRSGATKMETVNDVLFQAEDGIRDIGVTGVQTCALPISMGSKIEWISPNVGDGQSMKLVNQLLCGVHLAAAGEALAFARALGLDPQRAYEVVRDRKSVV